MKNKIIAFFSGLMFSFVSCEMALAGGLKKAGSTLGKVTNKAGIQAQSDITTIIGTGINAALSLVGLIFFALMIYAGILWMTARGEEEQITKARKIIIASLIGLFIVVSAYAVTKFVSGKLA